MYTDYNSSLPSFLQQVKAKLEDELRRTGTGSGNLSDGNLSATGAGYLSATGAGGSEGEIARQRAETKLFGLSGVQSDRIRQEMARYATMRDPRLR